MLKKLFVFILFISVVGFAENVTFTTPQNLSPLTGAVPQVATDSSGKYVYVITDGINILYSSDFGATFTNPDPGSTIFGIGDEPQIVTDSSGQFVYAIWTVGGGPDPVKIFYSHNFGVTWTDVDPTNTIFENGIKTQIETNSTGKYVYATWTDAVDGNLKIFVSSNFGVNWSQASGSFGTQEFSPQIAASDSGEFVYVATESAVNHSFQFSSDFGANWTKPFDITFDSLPQIAISSSGQYIYVIYQQIGGEVKIFRSSDFGASSTVRDFVPGQPIGGSAQNITTNSSGRRVYAILAETSDNDLNIFVSNDFGQNWVRTQTFGRSTTTLTNIITDNIGRHIYATWKEFTTNNIRIFASTDFGQTWQDGGSFGSGSSPQITTNLSGQKAYGVWINSNTFFTRGIATYFPITDLKTKRL